MEPVRGPDGEQLCVEDDPERIGSKAPFHVVYTDQSRETRWGFRCGNCGALDNAVDSMGRVQCNECSNRTKAEEWDAAHE